MPLFAAMVSAFFTALSGFLAKLFIARVALRIAGVAAIMGFGSVLMVTFNGVVAPMVANMFSTQFGQLIGLAFPPAAGTVIAGVGVVWIACTTYKLQVQAVKLTANM